MDRASTFSDPHIIRRLQTEFIPVVGDTHALQNGHSATAQWFQKMAGAVNPRLAKNETAQGFYVFAADGTAYGFNNNRAVERVTQFMDQGLERFRKNPPAKIDIPQAALTAAYAKPVPPDAVVVRVFSCIRPLPPGAPENNARVGRDHLWISADEVKAILSAAGKVGATVPLPPTLIARLTRFHLIDNVRGEPDMWAETDVWRAEFSARVEAVSDDFVIGFTGEFEMRTADGKRGYEGRIEGRFVIRGGTRQLYKFFAYAEGQAWGVSTYTPGAPEGRFPLVIAMLRADDEMAQVTPPQAAACGEEYLKPRCAAGGQ